MEPCIALMAYRGDYEPGTPIAVEKESFIKELHEPATEGLHTFICQNPACGKTFRRPIRRCKYCSNSCSGKMRWAKHREVSNG